MIRLGCQGWNYLAWVGPFYPPGTRPADFLATYARAFDTVEVDSTFYAVPAASTVRGWADRTPGGFTFALKLPQAITHEARFRSDALDTLAAFCDRARELGPKLGPVLLQCAPDFGPSEFDAFARFLPALPSDVRFAVEFRHPGWLTDSVLALLAAHRVALALIDARWLPRATMLALLARPTTDFHYLRWLGPDRDIVDYSHLQVDRAPELDLWGEAAARLKGFTMYGYVNNHWEGHSPASARSLQRRLDLRVVEPDGLLEQLPLL